MKFFISCLLTLTTALISAQAFSQQLIPFQARLTDGAGAVVADGVYAMNFNIYDAATGGTPLWTENHSTVSVVGGVVNVILGSIIPLDDPNGNNTDAVTFFATSGDRFIGITIGTGQEMVPRHQLIPSFHAVSADDAATLGGNLPSFYTPLTQHISDIQGVSNQLGQFTGAIVAFAGNCSTGWLLADGTAGTPDLRGRFLRGEPNANVNSLDFGGNDNAIVVSHDHNIDPPNTFSNLAGDHNHIQGAAIREYVGAFDYGSVTGGQRTEGTTGPGAYVTHPYTSNSGNFQHQVNIAPFLSSISGVSGVGANMPGYYEVVYCVKI